MVTCFLVHIASPSAGEEGDHQGDPRADAADVGEEEAGEEEGGEEADEEGEEAEEEEGEEEEGQEEEEEKEEEEGQEPQEMQCCFSAASFHCISSGSFFE